jgi:outer membrane protein W
MKRVEKIVLPALFFFICSCAAAQYNGNRFSVYLNYNYTTSSKLYLQPNSSDEYKRGLHSMLEKISGGGIELRALITDNFFVGLGADYIRKTEKVSSIAVVSDYTQNMAVDDGYEVIPVELTAYYLFPFSLKNFKLFMGGGTGYYFGSHVRTLGDISSETVSRETTQGIHVLVGLDYLMTDYLSLRGVLKFRDVEFSMKNKYNKLDGTHDGYPVKIVNSSFDSKVAVDGLVFYIGLALYF